MIEGRPQPISVEVSNNVQLTSGNQVLDKRSEGLVQNLNKSSVFVDQFEPKFKNPSIVSARRFNRSMTSISVPVTMQ